MGRYDDAPESCSRSAALRRRLGDRTREALALDALATAIHADDPAQARQHWADALRLVAGYGDPRAVHMAQRIEELLQSNSPDLTPLRKEFQAAEGRMKAPRARSLESPSARESASTGWISTQLLPPLSTL
jgi:hypothetical protein